jgi:hypothetical protein
VKIGDRVSPPRDELSASSTVMGEEFEVAAPHRAEPGTDQPNGPVAKVVCLPGDAGRHSALPEQPFGNRAIRLAGEVCISARRTSTNLSHRDGRSVFAEVTCPSARACQKRCAASARAGKLGSRGMTAATCVAAVAPLMSTTEVRS